MTTTTKTLGTSLREAREARRWTQRRLARRVNYSIAMISYIEKDAKVPSEVLAGRLDTVLNPDDRTFTRMARALHAQARRPTVRPDQLPPPPAMLVGREEMFTHLDATMTASEDTSSVAALEGPAGAGKTALAMAWAHHHREDYPDGILTAQLDGHRSDRSPAEPATVLTGLLAALNVEATPSSTEDCSRMLRSLLAERRMLLVLDDAASSDQVEPLLPGTNDCGVLITSRRRLTGLTLRSAAHRFPLTGVTSQAATDLLRRLVSPQRAIVADSPAACTLAAIADGCDRLPLALHAAAEVINQHPGHALSEIGEVLTGPRRLHVLTTAALGDPSALRTTLNVSYQQLSPLAARLFRGLGTLRHGTIDALQASDLLNVPLETAETAVATLLGQHLLTPQLDAAVCPPLIQLYAAELAHQERSVHGSGLADEGSDQERTRSGAGCAG